MLPGRPLPRGDVPCYAHHPSCAMAPVGFIAAVKDDVRALQLLLLQKDRHTSRYAKCCGVAGQAAATYGRLDAMKCLLSTPDAEKSATVANGWIDASIRNKRYPTLSVLLDHIPIDDETLVYFVKSGYVEAVTMICHRLPKEVWRNLTGIATRCYQFDLLGELVSRGHPWNAWILQNVTGPAGRADVLAFLLDRYNDAEDKDHRWHPLCAALSAAAHDDLNCMRPLWERWSRRPCSKHDHRFLEAASLRTNIVQFLWERGCRKGTDKAIEMAAKWGAMDTIDYLRDRGCPWPKDAMGQAARNGWHGGAQSMEDLDKRGCPWGDDVMERAITYGHLECVK